MKTFDNTLSNVSKQRLKALVGAKLLRWEQPFPMDATALRQRSFEHVRLETTAGRVILFLSETEAFPETCPMEILDEASWLRRIEGNPDVVHPEKWHSADVGKTIRDVLVYVDTETDIRGTGSERTVVHDACGIAFALDDGTSLLFEKTFTGSEVWDVSRQNTGSVRLSGRKESNVDSEPL